MATTIWKKYDFENRILEILRALEGRRHHMGPAFVTAYQIALEFAARYPGDYEILEKAKLSLGGKASGKPVSLPQYIARELSRRLKAGGSLRKVIEGGFISGKGMKSLSFGEKGKGGSVVESSMIGSAEDLSIFRLKPES